MDGNFVLTGNQRFNSIDTEWGNAVYGDVSIHTLFKITAEDFAGVFARSTLAGPLASRTGYQPYGVLHGDGILALGHAIGSAPGTPLRLVSVGFDPTGQDVHLQFDVAGIQASLTAWDLTTTDGRTGNLEINGTPYDLSEGALFAIQVEGEQVTVHQLENDISQLGHQIEDCSKFVRDNPDVVQRISPPSIDE